MQNKNIVTILNITVMFVITVLISLFLGKDLLSGDDVFQFVFHPNKTFLNDLMLSDHGSYLSWIMLKISSHGSSMLFGLHPQSNYLSGIIRGIDIALLCLLIPSFLFLKKKDNYLMPFFIIFSFICFLDIIKIEPKVLTDLSQHFRYIFGSLFYFGFWFISINCFLENRLPEKKDLCRNVVLAFVVGFSNEFCSLSTLGTIVFFFMYAFWSFGVKSKWVMSEIYSKFKKLGKGIYFPLLSFFMGIILCLFNPSFIEIFKDRVFLGEHNFIAGTLRLFPEFLSVYVKVLFKLNLLPFCIILLFIGMILLYKEKIPDYSKVLISSLSILFGVCLFYFSLIICGKTNFYNVNHFWIEHNDLQILLKLVLLAVVFLLFGALLKVPDIRKAFKSKIGVSIFLIIAVLFGLIFRNNIKRFYYTLRAHYVWLYRLLDNKRSTFYKTEKMYIFYLLKNKTAVLSKDNLTEDGLVDLNEIFDSPKEKNSNDVINDSPFLTVYYPAIYKEKKITGYKLVNDSEAMKEFALNSGVFEKDEIKKANFNRLFDKDFVLNKKKKSKNQ